MGTAPDPSSKAAPLAWIPRPLRSAPGSLLARVHGFTGRGIKGCSTTLRVHVSVRTPLAPFGLWHHPPHQSLAQYLITLYNPNTPIYPSAIAQTGQAGSYRIGQRDWGPGCCSRTASSRQCNMIELSNQASWSRCI